MTTLREYLSENTCEDDLITLIELIANQANSIRRAFLTNQSYADTENVYGEVQAELDTWSDIHLTEVLEASGLVCELASEEKPDVLRFPNAHADYAVVMDPLDGSSLIQINLTVGTIIGVYDNGNALSKGRDLRAAFYLLFGPMTVLTLSVGNGVATFYLNEEGEYILMEDNVTLPEGNLYGSGGLRPDWPDYQSTYINAIEAEGGKNRYTGSFVADFHQILKYGGLYCYPALKSKPNGKLRLVYEANPIGYLAEQAGGAISDGIQCLLDVKPEKPDHRVPIYVGSKSLIEKIEAIRKA